MNVGPEQFAFLQGYLKLKTGIVLDESKMYLVNSRLTGLARERSITIDQLIVMLKTTDRDGLKQQVIDALTTNETSFFRDRVPYDTLRTAILPEIFNARSASRQLNIWSAACSTGQEPYSVGIVLRDAFRDTINGWAVKILATDVCHTALRQARSARYSEHELDRGVDLNCRRRHFIRDKPGWVLGDDVRGLVEFRAMNLIEEWPPLPPMDVILLRNVMVYFDDETKRQVLSRVRQQLRPGGYLLLGGTETTLGLDNEYERVVLGGYTVYKSAGAGTTPSI